MRVDFSIPKEITTIINTLQNKGFLAYTVGGCVRDLILKKKPKDWDIATSAKPEEITALFPKTFYQNDFGTVTVVNETSVEDNLRQVEVTPFRKDGKYSDRRHPDRVSFKASLIDDLKRRDFTINALSYNHQDEKITDPETGLSDINNKLIRTVGNPDERFEEDPLRIIRGVRLATELGFTINTDTAKSMASNSHLLEIISKERVRDEFEKIIMSKQPMLGLKLLVELKIMPNVIRETLEMVGVEQNGDHIYDVWEHTVRVVQHGADRDWPLHVRLAGLFHDIGKPRTRRWSKEKEDWTFYGHDVIGAKMAEKIMNDLKFPTKLTETVVKLVRNHMFFSDIDKITLSAVRRIVARVGSDNVWDLMKVRACDRIGMGRPKETPYRLRKYESMIEEAMRAPTSVGKLKIGGGDVIRETGEKPGPRIGYILHALLEEILENPDLNTEEYLIKRTKEFVAMPNKELLALGIKAKEIKEAKEAAELAEIRRRHGVK